MLNIAHHRNCGRKSEGRYDFLVSKEIEGGR